MTRRIVAEISSNELNEATAEPGEKSQVSAASLATAHKKISLGNYEATLVERTMRHAADKLVSRSHRDRKQLLVDLVNMPGESGIDWFSRKWGSKLWPDKCCMTSLTSAMIFVEYGDLAMQSA